MKTFLHFLRVLALQEEPHSQVTEAELRLLQDYAKNAQTACEIGCYEGKTTVALAQVIAGTIYSVDPFFAGRLGLSYTEWIARLHARRHGDGKIRFLRGFSHEVAPRFTLPLNFLFIDADHSYEGVKRDWDDWVPKVLAGGIVAMHDARPAPNSPARLGTMDFYDREVLSSPAVRPLAGVDSLVVLQKVW